MAKRKPIATGKVQGSVGQDLAVTAPQAFFTNERLFGLAAGLIAASIIFAGFWPADSTAVQLGGARYLAGILILAGGIAIAVRPLWNEPGVGRVDRLADVTAWGLALSMVVSTWLNAAGGNVRLGLNEMWWWVAAAALFSGARRICRNRKATDTLLHLVISVTVAIAVFAWHQHWVGIPAMIQQYEANPEEVLREAGIDAVEGSGLRIVFQNRLYDGGPTGTFALANTMAAYLLGGLVVILGTAFQRWQCMSRPQKIGWVIVILVVGAMLVVSRSRSALGALVIVALIVCAQHGCRGRLTQIAKAAAVAVAACVMMILVGWKFLRDTEWVGQAPASVEVRLRYWIACVKMFAQSPWFGVGPGQFKARYELYRADVSTEQIADPHNWFWQIATTGGLVATAFAIALAVVILWRLRYPSNNFSERCRVSLSAIHIGAGGALAIAWIGGLAFGELPSVDASGLATLAGLAALWLAIRSNAPTSHGKDGHQPGSQIESPAGPLRNSHWIASYATVAILIDLMAAGGIIVPGVAVTLWLLIAILSTPNGQHQTLDSDGATWGQPSGLGADFVSRRSRFGIVGAVLVILAIWYATAILPVEKANLAKWQFQSAWQTGRLDEAESALRQAALADRWDAEATIQLASMLAQLAAADSQNRQRWEASLAEAQRVAIGRVGKDPVSLRMLGDNQLRLYQRYGDPQALQDAMTLLEQATQLAPAHEAYAAQLAEIYRQSGDDRALSVAQRAVTLSEAGGYHERSLPLVWIMPAQYFGEQVVEKEVRRPASEVLSLMLPSGKTAPDEAN
jgi:hypothetical protein